MVFTACKSSRNICPAYQSALSPKERKKYEERLLKQKINSTGKKSKTTNRDNHDLFGKKGPR